MKKKKSKNRGDADLKEIHRHLDEMVSASQNIPEHVKELFELLPNILGVRDTLDIAKAENDIGATWADFNRRHAHEWLGKAYAETELLIKCAFRADRISTKILETAEHARQAVELVESKFSEQRITSDTEVA